MASAQLIEPKVAADGIESFALGYFEMRLADSRRDWAWFGPALKHWVRITMWRWCHAAKVGHPAKLEKMV